MLRRIPEVFFGALLACTVFAMGFVFGSSQNSNPATHNLPPQKGGGYSSNGDQQEGSWIAPDSLLALFTLGLVFVGSAQVWLFLVQLRLIRESLTDAKVAAVAARDGADAAKLNAQALIDAESAQMYFIAHTSNIERLFQLGRHYDNSPTMHSSATDPPWIEYQLRNYGKSPAILTFVVHGLSIETPGVQQERTYSTGRDSLEIVGVGEQSLLIQGKFERPFTFGDVRSIVTNDRLLFFYGHADFVDHFGRKQTLEWEFLADDGKWKLISHRNTRENQENGPAHRGQR